MTVLGYVPIGFDGILVSVEVDIRRGLPGTEIVGMAGPPVREARERVRVAVRNSGFDYPRDRILINLAPADLPKVGSGFDLAIALAILAASRQIPPGSDGTLLAIGELGLDGSVRRVPGVIAAATSAISRGVSRVVVPEGNRLEAASVVAQGLVSGESLTEVVTRIGSGKSGPQAPGFSLDVTPIEPPPAPPIAYELLAANSRALRALIVSAVGRYNLLLAGPPGSGKTVLAQSIPALSPHLRQDECLEVTRIHSQAGALPSNQALVRYPPFRAPHHTSSLEGVVGGGPRAQPGEISLAHRGVLFLDEALEFRKNVLQGLREPLERRRVHLARAGRSYWYPADVQLILACNACPCGNLGKPGGRCTCSLDEISRYWRRLGGPLLDRIPLRVPFVAAESQRCEVPLT